jgi:DNA-binding CsgD family transcriptional regulator
LEPGAVRAYRLLLRLPTASIGELAAVLDMSMMDVRSALSGLEDKGLVGRLPGATHRFRAEPPERALGPLVRRRHHELRAMRADVDTLRDEYRVARAGRRDVRSSVDLVSGADNMRTWTEQLISGATTDVCVVATGPFDAFADVPARVKVRAIYPRAVLASPPDRPGIARELQGGVQIRMARRPPVDMVVVDRLVAMLPVHSDHARATDPAAVVVWPGGLHDTLLALFESAWALATPLRAAKTGELIEEAAADIPTPEDLTLLRLLLDGLTDQAIAGRLGVGERTVQRRVRDLIDLVGAQTRLQLIWQAAQRGWI